ncbi:MAG: hypothetical protein ACFE91_01330 [Promethearchaeota archaeon]
MTPFIKQLEKLDHINRDIDEREILLNTNIIDLVIHRYIYFNDNTFLDQEDFLDYIVKLFIRLFRIKIS